MENNNVFIEKYISKQRKKEGCSCNLYVLQGTKNSHLFDKNCTPENVKCHVNKVDLDES